MSDGLLLVHAFPVDARMWDQQVEAFAGVPVIAPHLPGFGGTEGPDVMTMSSGAERCLAEADRAGFDRFVLCGLSMGGYVSFEIFRRASDRILALCLANTRSGADADEAKEGRRALAERLGSEGNGFLVERPPPLLSDHAEPALWERVKALIAGQPAGSIAAAALGMAERRDSTEDLGSIRVPSLVITSADDTLIPPAATTPMAEQIPGAELVTIPAAGHLSNLEAPHEFNAALAALLQRVGLGPG
jgi:3-oxoadipate enol-lactonase